MEFAFSEEREALRDGLRKFMVAKSPSAEVRRLMVTDEGYDAKVWRQMADELGLQGLLLPEEYGGQGFGFVELCIVLEEMGRVLLCAPFFSTVCLAAAGIMNVATPDEKAELLPQLASGSVVGTLAFTEPSGKWDATGVTLEAVRSRNSWTLNGTKMLALLTYPWVP